MEFALLLLHKQETLYFPFPIFRSIFQNPWRRSYNIRVNLNALLKNNSTTLMLGIFVTKNKTMGHKGLSRKS